MCRGDVLVLDNASVHVGHDTFSTIVEKLSQLGIMYSPELNPVEYVFGFLKKSLRASRNHDINNQLDQYSVQAYT